jgi:hypothetical protein
VVLSSADKCHPRTSGRALVANALVWLHKEQGPLAREGMPGVFGLLTASIPFAADFGDALAP